MQISDLLFICSSLLISVLSIHCTCPDSLLMSFQVHIEIHWIFNACVRTFDFEHCRVSALLKKKNQNNLSGNVEEKEKWFCRLAWRCQKVTRPVVAVSPRHMSPVPSQGRRTAATSAELSRGEQVMCEGERRGGNMPDAHPFKLSFRIHSWGLCPDAGLISTLPWMTLAWEQMIVTVATLYCRICVYEGVQCRHLTFDLKKKKKKAKYLHRMTQTGMVRTLLIWGRG